MSTTRKTHKSRRRAPTTQGSSEPGQSLVAVVPDNGSSSVAGLPVPAPLPAKDVPDKPSETGDSDQRSVVMLPPPKPEKPYWYRPPDSKARKLFAKIAVQRAAGHDDAHIAKKLGTTAGSIKQYVYLAKMNGWADQDGEPVDLEAQMALDVDRKLVRNIDRALDGGFTNYQTHEVTMMLAKQRKVVTDIDAGGSGESMPNVVAIQIVMPPLSLEQQTIVEANVGGVPAFQEGQVVDGLPTDTPT